MNRRCVGQSCLIAALMCLMASVLMLAVQRWLGDSVFMWSLFGVLLTLLVLGQWRR